MRPMREEDVRLGTVVELVHDFLPQRQGQRGVVDEVDEFGFRVHFGEMPAGLVAPWNRAFSSPSFAPNDIKSFSVLARHDVIGEAGRKLAGMLNAAPAGTSTETLALIGTLLRVAEAQDAQIRSLRKEIIELQVRPATADGAP